MATWNVVGHESFNVRVVNTRHPNGGANVILPLVGVGIAMLLSKGGRV